MSVTPPSAAPPVFARALGPREALSLVIGRIIGSGIFKSGNPAKRAHAIVQAVTHYNDPQVLAEVSEDLGEPMVGINVSSLDTRELLAPRGW